MTRTPIQELWQELHKQPRFRPLYPSEVVVRFLVGCFGQSLEERRRVRVLDVGCGAGRHTVLAAELGFSSCSLDVSIPGLEETHQRLAGRGLSAMLSAGTMHALPYKDNLFEGVISYGVAEYNDWPGMERAVAELYRVLTPGGKALVVTRTMADSRSGRGKRIDDHSYLLDTPQTNESGMVNCFLDRNDVAVMFRAFRAFQVERTEVTRASGWLDSDWNVIATK